MQIHINPHDELPVYRQIERQITRAIARHELEPGELLLPEDQLAAQLVVSPLSVHKAYECLRSRGLCWSSTDGGYQIAALTLGSDHAHDPTTLQRELLAHELRSAREVQQRLLPPSEILGDSWRVSWRSFPAGALAGDFFAVSQTETGPIGVTVADVAGKGLAAGLIMAVAQAMLPDVTAGRGCDDVLLELNRRLSPLLSRREFVALAHCRFDPADDSLEIANAGLPDPYLIRDDGSVQTLCVDGPRLPLGTGLAVPYSSLRTRLGAGDRLLLITDGIPEATDRAGEPIGYRGVSRILQTILHAEQPYSDTAHAAHSLLDSLLEKASELSGSFLEDDWTAVLLERCKP